MKYAVVRISDERVLYLGGHLVMAARSLVGSACHASGESEDEAFERAVAKVREYKEANNG